MNPTSVELTMQELAQTALGVPKITRSNLLVLQSLIDLILKKLDCQNETVTATGYESQNLQQLLRQSKISPLPLKDEKLDTLSAKMKRLSALEDRMAAVMKKLDDHLADVGKCNKKEDTSNDWDKWAFFHKGCEDFCTIVTQRNSIGCNLLKNPYFMKPLMRLVADPLTERMKESSQKIENLHLELLDFTRLAHEHYKKIVLVDGCICQIKSLLIQIEQQERRFYSVLEEIESTLDSKLGKIYIAGLRKFLRKYIDEMEKLALTIKKPPDMPKPSRSNATACLSCGGVKTCSAVPFHIHAPYEGINAAKPIMPPYCGCRRPCLGSRHQAALRRHIDASDKSKKWNPPQPRLSCEQ